MLSARQQRIKEFAHERRLDFRPPSSAPSTVIWVAVSFVFVGLLWWYLGGMSGGETERGTATVKAIEFITGYLVEKALAVDNIFVFLMVFTYFACRRNSKNAC